MRLHEYQAKQILAQHDVPVPRGEVAASLDQIYWIANRLGKRVVLKAQVLTGGRGQAGGIRLANDADEATRLAEQMLGMHIAGYPVSRVLIDEAIEIQQEIYVGITIDRSLAQPVILASAVGGVDIAEVAHDMPDRVRRVRIDPLLGPRPYQMRRLAEEIDLEREQFGAFVSIALGLYRVFSDCDATLVEANPLVIDPEGRFYCLNSRIVIDDHALFRHRDLANLWDESQNTLSERLARRYGITYVRLGGHVGCLSNGAGLAMATTDLLRSCGIRPANFVDVGKGANAIKIAHGLRLARNDAVDTVIVNIFASLTGCDEIARGILVGYQDLDVPLVVRLAGPKQHSGRALLDTISPAPGQPRVYVVDSLRDAVNKAIALTDRRRQEEYVG